MNDAAATVDCPGRAAIGRRVQTANACLLAGICLALAPVAATATDLSVTKLEVNQQIQLGSTTMIAGRPTFVRATIGTGGEQVPGVDAALHVFVDGVEAEYSPVLSMNGPITAPVNLHLSDKHTPAKLERLAHLPSATSPSPESELSHHMCWPD